VERRAARDPITGDDVGLTRAYNHRITGSQYCLVIRPLVTEDVLGIWHDQNSCQKCLCALSRSSIDMIEIGNGFDAALLSSKHDGVCYNKSKNSPTTAEEYVYEKAAFDFIIDEKTGKPHRDDFVIFSEEIVTNRDTRGPNTTYVSKSRLWVHLLMGLRKNVQILVIL
jgi:hypothetical protein